MARQSDCKFQLLWQINFYLQGLTLASNCSQLPGAGRKKPLNIAEFLALLGVGEGLAPPESPRAIQGNQRAGQATALTAAQQDGAAKPPAAGTPLGQGRPGGENHPAIGPAAMVAWCGGRTRRHSKGNGPNTSLTQAHPRTPRGVLRGERPKRFFPPFLIGEKWGPAERPHRGRRSALEKSEKDRPSVCLMAETCPPAGSASPGWQAETRKTIEGQTLFPKREEKGLLQAQPATAPK